jgi:putative transposase
MTILPNQLYHIYNQGNNKEQIFKDRADYLLFLKKYREIIHPITETVCYSLMPNHFHFLINTTPKSAEKVLLGKIESTQLGNGFRLLTSGYANEFNKKYDRSGSLFRQKTQAKNLETIDNKNIISDYSFICFQYIHQNAMIAKLCSKMEDWEFSSFRDYLGMRNGTLVNQKVAFDLIGASKVNFYEESYRVISEEKIAKLF